jgi:hypothetical protein
MGAYQKPIREHVSGGEISFVNELAYRSAHIAPAAWNTLSDRFAIFSVAPTCVARRHRASVEASNDGKDNQNAMTHPVALYKKLALIWNPF